MSEELKAIDQINEVIDAKAYAQAIVDELLSQRAKIAALEHDREQLRNKHKNAKATLLNAIRERNELEAEAARLREALSKFADLLVYECREKHALHPNEANLNLDYHVTLTIAIGEIRNLLALVGQSDAPVNED